MTRVKNALTATVLGLTLLSGCDDFEKGMEKTSYISNKINLIAPEASNNFRSTYYLKVPTCEGDSTTIKIKKFGIVKDEKLFGKIPLEEAIKFDLRFFSEAINDNEHEYVSDYFSLIYESGISADIANSYPCDFILPLLHIAMQNKMSPEIAKKYSSDFSPMDKVMAFSEGLGWEIANMYDSRFKKAGVVNRLFEKGFTPAEANAYSDSLKVEEIMKLADRNLMPEDVKGFHKSFNLVDLNVFKNKNISREYANKFGQLNENYDAKISGGDVIYFKEKNIPYSTVKEEAIRAAAKDRVAK